MHIANHQVAIVTNPAAITVFMDGEASGVAFDLCDDEDAVVIEEEAKLDEEASRGHDEASDLQLLGVCEASF